MKIVLANGVFDLLHAGHVAHLKEARTFGDLLIVSLTLDANVNKGPGRPIYTWEERAACLRELRCVAAVIPTASASEAIRKIKPAIFAKGIDYEGGDKFSEPVLAACLEVGAAVRFTQTPKYSATETILKVMRAA